MTFEDAVDDVLKNVREVLIARQRKYGSENINEFGEMGVVVRLMDKAKRLKRWYFEPSDIARSSSPDETIDDTWIDLAGYASIGLMLRRDTWGMPLEIEIEEEGKEHS